MPAFRYFGSNRITNDTHLRATDPDGRPLCVEITHTGNFVSCDSSGERSIMHVLYQVSQFGCVVLKTLPLPDVSDAYILPYELARSKIAQIESCRLNWASGGFQPSRLLKVEIDAAARLLEKAKASLDIKPSRCSAVSEKALLRALWAAEALAIEAARYGVERKIAAGSAVKMKLGANLFGFKHGEILNDRFRQAFNHATLPFHWQSFEPVPGMCNWCSIDNMLQWLDEHGIEAKGHPLVWMCEPHYPQWARRETFKETLELNLQRIRSIVERYRGRIKSWDIVNEAHEVDRANIFSYSREQLLELTGAAAATARETDPAAVTIINTAEPFGEYAHEPSGRWTPLDYISACVDTGVDFDAIGVQFYNGAAFAVCRDLLEISAQLDKFGEFGKPVHVTAAGCPSSCAKDTGTLAADGNTETAGYWHDEWCEALQADWVEKFYFICCGKPFVEAVSWRDLADYPKHHFPHSGLLRRDLSPKPAYERVTAMARRLGTK